MRQEMLSCQFPLIFLGCALAAAALPELYRRQQQCDTLNCPGQSWFTDFGDKIQDTWQLFGGYQDEFLLKTPPEPQIPTAPTMPILPGGSEIKPQNPYETELAPQLEPFSGTEKCPVGAPELNYDSSDQNPNFGQCTVAPAQVVVPADCTSPKNAMVAQKLVGIDPSVKTSRSPRCPGENGVVFWLAHLTPDQAVMIMSETNGAVEGIVLNAKLKSNPLTPAPELMASQEASPRITKMGNRLKKKKRDILEVESREWDRTSDPSLTFLSTPPGRTNLNGRRYTYFKTAIDSAMQQDIRVYLVDSGYSPGSDQIRADRMEWLYPLGATKEESDNDEEGHGTCMVSKVGSPNFGVLPGGPVFTIVKIEPTVASFIDAFGSILTDVRTKGSAVQARAVIQITGNWILMDHQAYIVQLMRDGINSLLSSKIMVVSPAPIGDPGEDLSTWPSSLAGLTDMITVGAVIPSPGLPLPYGAKYPWSLGPPETVTVNAPGAGLCKNIDGSIRVVAGPGMAAAVTTGLVAYFLAIPDLQAYFAAQTNWAFAVKRYVVAMAYPRYQLVAAVWNGLDSENIAEIFNTPGEPWIGIPYAGNPRFE